MAFGICRVRSLHMADLQSTDMHNARRYDSPEHYPANIRPDGHHQTTYFRNGLDDAEAPHQTNLEDIVRSRMEQKQITEDDLRKNSRIAIEYVLGISDAAVWNNYSPAGYFEECLYWLEQKHGEGSVVAYSRHQDESNPHAHFVVVPIEQKEIKWKNAKGSGSKIKNVINVRDFVNGKETLRSLQQEYYEFAKQFEKKLGIELYRGTLAENQTKQYARQTDHKIGEIRAELARLKTFGEKSMEYLQKQIELAKNVFKRENLNVTEKQLEQKKKEDKYTRENWWKKGTSSNDFFHDKKKGNDPGPNRSGGFSM